MTKIGKVLNKDIIDVDMINQAISDGQLIILADWMIGNTAVGVTKVIEIKKSSRPRKDGIERYYVHYTEFVEDDGYCYSEECCGCCGNGRSSDSRDGPMTSAELVDKYFFYPQYRVKLSEL